MRYIAYIPETGEVTGVFIIDGTVKPIVSERERLLEVPDTTVLPDFFYVSKRRKLVAIAPSSNPFDVFCYKKKIWVPDPKTVTSSRTYQDIRRDSYPEVGDQLDAVVKLARYLQDIGHELPLEVQNWINECQQVKDQYPAM